MKSFFHLFSFGNYYVSATFFYLGLGFILFAVTPELPQSFAQCDSCETGCGGEECNGQ
ncbi:MAG: hypothetical protein LBC20_15085 [Planctomycetaceae bacterium]|jgi:hypothetical protein|nr:hypothetical protein [Planctomycetaceae bacterium]